MTTGSIDHLSGFSFVPPGTLVIRRHWDGDDIWFTVINADPQVEFCPEFLANVFNDVDYQGDSDIRYHPHLWIDLSLRDCTAHDWNCPLAPGICYLDGLFHIEGRDRHVIYRIIGYDERNQRWVGRWPD